MNKTLFKFVVFFSMLILVLPSQFVKAEEAIEDGNFQTVDLSKKFVPKSDEELDALYNSSEDYSVELTYEQAVQRTAEIQGKTVEQVKAENPQGPQLRATTCSWIETRNTVSVKTTNKTLIVIVRACRDGSFGWMDKNTKPLLQEFMASNHYYSGSVQVDIRATGFYYVANGNFYNNTSVTYNGTTGTSGIFTATYSVSSTSNHFSAIYTGLKWKQVVN